MTSTVLVHVTLLNCAPGPSFAETFQRCCREFEDLFFASPYCCWPAGYLRNSSLKELNSITAVLGPPQNGGGMNSAEFIEFAEIMKDEGKKVHIHEFQQPRRLHAKLYVFRKSDKSRALIIGSTNFTHSAFYSNEELDVLLEGKLEGPQIESLRQRVNEWVSSSVCLTGECGSK